MDTNHFQALHLAQSWLFRAQRNASSPCFGLTCVIRAHQCSPTPVTRTDNEYGCNSLSFEVWTSKLRHCRVQGWPDLKIISSCAYSGIIKIIITVTVFLAQPPHIVSCKEWKAIKNKQASLKDTLWLCRLQKSLGSSLDMGDSEKGDGELKQPPPKPKYAK